MIRPSSTSAFTPVPSSSNSGFHQTTSTNEDDDDITSIRTNKGGRAIDFGKQVGQVSRLHPPSHEGCGLEGTIRRLTLQVPIRAIRRVCPQELGTVDEGYRTGAEGRFIIGDGDNETDEGDVFCLSP
ncbi:unnamed protein product [Larinioides sclopetarius]|uniref:Uncharacterized protein n=1 Tax=Larinioides sclopetarius TaxID=280406 RepID=A0AAV2AT53_9ARAC